MQVAAAATPQPPLLQVNFAEPVVGAVPSTTATVSPELVKGADAEHELPLTDHDSTLAAHAGSGCAWQVEEVAALHVPLAQAYVAEPVTGSTESIAVALAPDSVAGSEAEHVAVPELHVTDLAEQGVGAVTLHDAADAEPHEPLVHANDAVPVAGRSLSVAVAVLPELVLDNVPEHVLPFTVQVTDCAPQLDGGGWVEVWQW